MCNVYMVCKSKIVIDTWSRCISLNNSYAFSCNVALLERKQISHVLDKTVNRGRSKTFYLVEGHYKRLKDIWRPSNRKQTFKK